ncbi:ABC transporter permease [Paenibacillus sp. ACRRX]|uniref:ABC transporter permease n=1 Tax=Paenibacillus sp. ACRRX TaxID=2918206 RepID=UPI001EF4DCA9|nr:ABC transporter permease [Paenibacillus sp. ACRRX]MCG7406174.1 ABC transporter permease [Paenibacillus sp. ACRRX]
MSVANLKELQPEPGRDTDLQPVLPLPPSEKPIGLWQMAFKKFMSNPFAVSGLVVLLFFVIVALSARVIAPYDPAAIDLLNANLPAGSPNHLFGTDELGRDILTRLIYSSQVSLLVGFSVAIISVVIGTIIGSVSGYFGGFVDTFFMRIVDVMNSIPTLFLNILVLSIFGSKFSYMIIIMGFTSWMGSARLVRGTFLQLREMQYVEAARAIGVSSWSIIGRHLLRNSTAPIIVNATLMVGGAILAESGLSYLGLGVQLPDTSWGLMLSNAQQFMLVDPMQALYPGLCIFLVVLAVNFIGDGIRDAFDPRKKVKIPRRRLQQWRENFLKSKI